MPANKSARTAYNYFASSRSGTPDWNTVEEAFLAGHAAATARAENIAAAEAAASSSTRVVTTARRIRDRISDDN